MMGSRGEIFRALVLCLSCLISCSLAKGDTLAALSLNFSSPAPYIFSSLRGLSQQWANTFFPTGHTITACDIPKYTLLYHGRHDNNTVPSPEWLAFDVEMAYGIMGNMHDSRMLTYRTNRRVKCIYFDGSSANLMGSGIESQMTFLYGDSESIPVPHWPPRPGHGHPRPPGRYPPGGGRQPPSDEPPSDGQPPTGPPLEAAPDESNQDDPDTGRWNPLEDEYFRARGLCKWISEQKLGGPGWGYEGIVRMNAAFELIWCDFDSPSLTLMSNLNISAPRLENPSKDGTKNTAAESPSSFKHSNFPSPHSNQIILEDEGPHGPWMTDPREPFRNISSWMWFTAATKRYGPSGNQASGASRGEPRVQIDACGFFSFYDPRLQHQQLARAEAERVALNISASGRWIAPDGDADARAAALEKLVRRRRLHRVSEVSKADGEIMRRAVEERLRVRLLSEEWVDGGRPGVTVCSGVDWHLNAQEVVAFYSEGLREILRMLILIGLINENDEGAEGSDEKPAIREMLAALRERTHWLMLPYFEYPPGPHTEETLARDYSLDSTAAEAALERCRKQYGPVGDELEHAPKSEHLLEWSFKETLNSICTTVFDVGLALEREWLLNFNYLDPNSGGRWSLDAPTITVTRDVVVKAQEWKETVEELMAWLGWAELWTGCEGFCKPSVSILVAIWIRMARLTLVFRSSVIFPCGQ